MKRTASGAAGYGLDTSIKYLRRTTSRAAGSDLSRCRRLLMCPFTTSALPSPFLVRASLANKKSSTPRGLGFRCPVFVRGARAFSLCSFSKIKKTFVTFFFGGSKWNSYIFLKKLARITLARSSLPTKPQSERASYTPRPFSTTRATLIPHIP
jgi:hypothetical protein